MNLIYSHTLSSAPVFGTLTDYSRLYQPPSDQGDGGNCRE